MTPAPAPVLAVSGLSVEFLGPDGVAVRVIHGVDLAVGAGETLALVGESGSGKSATSLAIMGLHDPRATRLAGAIRLAANGPARDLLRLSPRALRQVRGREVAMVFQEPMTSLNPVRRVGAQIAEGLRLHRHLTGRALAAAVEKALGEVGIADPVRSARAYPHELSGGMRQRVLIALALACDPALLIADEPTTALDVTVQAQVLELLRRIQRARGMAMLFISHNLAIVARIADHVAVMYAGRIVEQAPVADLFARPRHPYTRALLDSLPEYAASDQSGRRLRAIAGVPADPRSLPSGCAFEGRCAMTLPCCAATMPLLAAIGADRAARCHRWAEL